MTLRHLKIFVSVCEHSSTTLAARELHISQPSISLALSELENYYGQKLFDRISNRLHITEAGKQFSQYARHIVSLFDAMEKGTRNWDVIGVMRIGASVTIGNCLLPGYVRKFQIKQSGIEMQLIIDNTAAIEQLVIKSDVDFGLVEGAISDSCIVAHPFAESALAFICPPDHPWTKVGQISAQTLTEANLILRERGSSVRGIIERTLSILKVECKSNMQSISTQAIIRAVGKGLGVSALPLMLVEESIKRGEIGVFQVEGATLVQHFSVIYHKNKFLTNATKDFIESNCGVKL